MLMATETRKASVHCRLRKPSTKRSEVVNPTSNKPPTINHSQGMKILSLDDRRLFVTLPPHGQSAHRGQHDRAVALSFVSRAADRRRLDHPSDLRRLSADGDGRLRRRRDDLPVELRPAVEDPRGRADKRSRGT